MLEANLSSWSKANLVLTYFGAPIPWNHLAYNGDGCTEKNSGGNKNVSRVIKHSIVAHEAYVTIGVLKKNPFYLVVGKKQLPFGEYTDPYTPYQLASPAQMFAQTNAVTAIAGISTDFGFYGSLFAFRGETSPVGATSNNIRNYGVKLGYYDHLNQFNLPNTHFNVSVGYLRNLWDTDALSPNADPNRGWGNWGGSSTSTKIGHPAVEKYDTSNPYNIDPVGGLNAHMDIAYKAFSMSANYTTALEQMLPDDQYSDRYNTSRLWGADVNADYSFKSWNHNSSLGAGIQFSGNAAWFADNKVNKVMDLAKMIPRWRLVGEYKINLFKNTDLSLAVTHGKSYEFAKCTGNTGDRKSTMGLARLSVQF